MHAEALGEIGGELRWMGRSMIGCTWASVDDFAWLHIILRGF
jgi:hypothetical protein